MKGASAMPAARPLVRKLGLLAAAALALTMAAVVGASLTTPDEGENAIVVPAERVGRSPIGLNQGPAHQPTLRSDDKSEQAPVDPMQRFDGSVARNPFAALNFRDADLKERSAGAPQAAAKPASAPSVKPGAQLPQPASAAPQPLPVNAPALPFTAVGAIQGDQVTDGKLVAFIKRQEELLLVRAGDSIGSAYRVESVSPQAIEFIYLPLMQRQTLTLAQ
jgi:hypothetical protein